MPCRRCTSLGYQSLAELEERERRLNEISDALLASDERGIDARLRDPNRLLVGEIPRAKAELAKHCTEITLTPEGKTNASA